MADRSRRRIIYGCFLISGAAGLIYEVVWARQLALFLGITTYAHTAVITAYMIGLAAGSLVLGRVADRCKESLHLYAWLEVGIGLYAATTPWLFSWVQSLYGSAATSFGVTGTLSHLLRFVLALLGLLLPTFLMGGTLPLLVRGLTGSLPSLAKEVGRLYGINTLGAALGTFAAGYLLLPGLGMRRTVFLAVLLNLGVAAVILAVWRRLPARAVSVAKPVKAAPKAEPSRRTAVAAALLIGFAISGFAALVYEIAWIRALTLVIGSSVYAFSTTLTTYLVGLALGSVLYARFLADRGSGRVPTSAGRRMAQAAVLEVIVGWSAVLGLLLIGRLPELFLRGYQAGLQESFVLFQAFIFSLCFLVMFLPVLLLGALFPLLTALWTRDAKGIGRGVGTAYAANTGGTVLGALLGGLLLLPMLGVQNSLLLAAGLHVLVGASFWLLRPARTRQIQRYATAAAALLLLGLASWIVPPWDRAMMTSGAFANAGRLIEREPNQSLRDRLRERQLLYYAEGADGIVKVEEAEGERFLVINGKDDASSRSDLPTQVLLGELPMLIHPDPREVLVIGLGSGITVGSTATHDSVAGIDVLEISPEVVAASRFFAAQHGDVLSDPRVQLIVADARNFILAQSKTYDVITSEPSNPWISGISNLFTKDFFELARARLAPGGVMAQWLEMYNMSSEDVKTVLHTYQTVFPHVSVWMPMLGDLILIGSEGPHPIDHGRLVRALAGRSVRVDLERIGMADPAPLLSTFLLGSEELAGYAAGAPINTDQRPRIEFNAPRYLYANASLANLLDIIRSLDGALIEVPVSGMASTTAGGLRAPGLGLAVETNGTPADGDWQTAWLMGRRIVSAEEGESPELTISSLWTILVRKAGSPRSWT